MCTWGVPIIRAGRTRGQANLGAAVLARSRDQLPHDRDVMDRVAHHEGGFALDRGGDKLNGATGRGHHLDGDLPRAADVGERAKSLNHGRNGFKGDGTILFNRAAAFAMLVCRTSVCRGVGERSGVIEHVTDMSADRGTETRIKRRVEEHAIVDAPKQ
jgi:hypothetical protein